MSSLKYSEITQKIKTLKFTRKHPNNEIIVRHREGNADEITKRERRKLKIEIICVCAINNKACVVQKTLTALMVLYKVPSHICVQFFISIRKSSGEPLKFMIFDAFSIAAQKKEELAYTQGVIHLQ